MKYQEAALKIAKRIKDNDFIISEHVIRSIMAGKIRVRMIKNAVLSGKIIEVHKHPARGSSFLVAGFSDKKPVHVVCCFSNAGYMIFLFVYIPSLPVWKDHLTRDTSKRSSQMNHKIESRVQNCFFCGGEVKNITYASFDYRLKGELYVINNVNAGLCSMCGEKYISSETAERIDDLIAAGSFSGTQEVHVVRL